jgi:hypothetical protein
MIRSIKVRLLAAASLAFAALLPTVLPQQAAYANGPAFTFSRANAIAYANKWEFNRNTAKFDTYPDNCTNYASQVWWAGGAPLDSDGGYQWYFQPPVWGVYFATHSWTVSGDFRDYWYDNTHVVYYYDYDVTQSYNPAHKGDAIVYSRGDNGYNAPDFHHVGIEHHYNSTNSTDYEIQNTTDEIVPWNTWYYHSSSTEQFYQRYWGYRIIWPISTYEGY